MSISTNPISGERDPATPPWIAAHVLSSAEFSPRAGLIAHELSADDAGEEERPASPRLDWLPDYDAPRIGEGLQRLWTEVGQGLDYGLWWVSLCVVVALLYDPRLGIVLGMTQVVFGPWLSQKFKNIILLQRRRRAALQAGVSLDIADLGKKEQVVNWWALRKAGFSIVKPREALSDPTLRLAGKPFLILQYQSLRIPVVRKHRGKHELRPQNRARLSAYCHLIETVERGQAPFGVLMFAGSYEVLIVPNSHLAKSTFHRALGIARKVVADSQRGTLPEAPAANCCLDCPLGFPRAYRPGVTDEHLKVLKGAFSPRLGADGRKYHSVCGDRFEWLPPNRRAQEKELG